jgi:hypothetical protein
LNTDISTTFLQIFSFQIHFEVGEKSERFGAFFQLSGIFSKTYAGVTHPVQSSSFWNFSLRLLAETLAIWSCKIEKPGGNTLTFSDCANYSTHGNEAGDENSIRPLALCQVCGWVFNYVQYAAGLFLIRIERIVFWSLHSCKQTAFLSCFAMGLLMCFRRNGERRHGYIHVYHNGLNKLL